MMSDRYCYCGDAENGGKMNGITILNVDNLAKLLDKLSAPMPVVMPAPDDEADTLTGRHTFVSGVELTTYVPLSTTCGTIMSRRDALEGGYRGIIDVAVLAGLCDSGERALSSLDLAAKLRLMEPSLHVAIFAIQGQPIGNYSLLRDTQRCEIEPFDDGSCRSRRRHPASTLASRPSDRMDSDRVASSPSGFPRAQPLNP
jgi:hypothetical protein